MSIIARITEYRDAPDYLLAYATMLTNSGHTGFSDYVEGVLYRAGPWGGAEPDSAVVVRHMDAYVEGDEAASVDKNDATRAFIAEQRDITLAACEAAGFSVQVVPPLIEGRPNLKNPPAGVVYCYDRVTSDDSLERITTRRTRGANNFPGTDVSTNLRFRGPDAAVGTDETPNGPFLQLLINTHMHIMQTWQEGRIDL